MTLALAPQCCCGRAGFLRAWAGICYAAIHPSELDYRGWLPAWAEWMYPRSADPNINPYEGWQHYESLMWEASAGHHHILGYDHETDKLIFTYREGSEPRTHDFFGSVGGLAYVHPRHTIAGYATRYWYLDTAAGQAVLDAASALPPGDPGSPVPPKAYWSALSNGRLYGWTEWQNYRPPGEANDRKVRVWSCATDGTDYQEHWVHAAVQGDSGFEWVLPISVADGHFYTCGASSGVSRIRIDGNLFATVDDSVGFGRFLTALGMDDVVFGFADRANPYSGNPTMHVIDGDTNQASSQLRFVAIEDGAQNEYWPVGIAWDPRARAVVINWDSLAQGVFGPIHKGYLTYIDKPILPGNVVGQEGVTIYAHHLSGAVASPQPNSPLGFGIMLTGKMPTPMEVQGIEIINPPPPEEPDPPLKDCDNLDADCFDLPGFAYVTGLRDVHEGPGNESGVPYNDKVWTYGNFNRPFNVTKTIAGQGIPPGSWCTGQGTGLRYDFWAQLGEQSNYANPGILLRYIDFGTPTARDECYVYGIGFGLTCSSGELRIEKVIIAINRWLNYSDADTNWPAYFGPLHQYCTIIGQLVEASPAVITGGDCATGSMASKFSFDNWLAGAASGAYSYTVNLTLGAQT